MLAIDEKSAISRFMELAKVVGPSGKEAAVMQRIKELLTVAGIDPTCFQHDDAHLHSRFGGEIGNLIVKLPGTPARSGHVVVGACRYRAHLCW